MNIMLILIFILIIFIESFENKNYFINKKKNCLILIFISNLLFNYLRF